MSTPLRIPCRLVRAYRAGPWLRRRVGLFTVAGAFALATTVVGADILADRLSDRHNAGATVVQVGGFTAGLTLIGTGGEARWFNVSDEFPLLRDVSTAGRAACTSPRTASASLLSQVDTFVGPGSGEALDGVDCVDALAPTDGPLFMPHGSRTGAIVRLTLPRGGVGLDHHGS